MYGLYFTWLSQRMSDKQKSVLALLLDYMLNGRAKVVLLDHFLEPKAPTSSALFRKYFGQGRNSIPSCLPRPPIVKLENGHIYVSIIDCVRDLLGHGHRVRPLFAGDLTRVHAQSPRGQYLLRSAQEEFGFLPSGDACCFVLPMYLWEDDFDCNNIKTNRNKVWSLFISIATPQHCIHSGSNTYLVGLGPADESHSEVYFRLQHDLNLLVSKFGPKIFYAPWGLKVPVYAPMYSFQADRPAKSQVAYSLCGNGTFHACFGVSGDLGALVNKIVPCEGCYTYRMKHVRPQYTGDEPSTCPHCADWQIIGLEYKAPLEYPRAMAPVGTPLAGPIMLKVKRISFASMGVGMKNAFVGLVGRTRGHRWNEKMAKDYMRVECIDSKQQDQICEQAKSYRAKLYPPKAKGPRCVGVPQPTDPPIPSAEEMATHVVLPPTHLYPHLDLFVLICCLMHQVFLGIVKTTFSEFLVAWLKSHFKCSHFIREANKRILMLKKLRLVFLKLETITEGTSKFGKFVSENYLAICRLSKWLCSGLEEYDATDVVYMDPTGKEPSEYNKKQCIAWLKARQICFDKETNVSTLRIQIMSLMKDAPNGTPPPIIPPDKITAPPSAIYLLMEALLCMVSRTMLNDGISEDDRYDVDRHIKIFLSLVAALAASKEKAAGKSPDHHPAIGKYNLITLLQVARDMFTMGSLRQMFEGDGKGEGALPLLKTAIQSLSANFAFHAGERYYKARALDRVAMEHIERMKELYGEGPSVPTSVKKMLDLSKLVFGNLDESLGEADEQDEKEDSEWICGTSYKEFHMYKSVEEVHEQFANGMPLSVLCFEHEDGRLRWCVILKGGVELVRLHRVRDSPDCVRNGASYFKWSIDRLPTSILGIAPNLPVAQQRDELKSAMKHNCVFLPLLSLSSDISTLYYVITSEWEEMCEDGWIDLPRLSCGTY
jgi:hypothetical protein